MGPYKIEFAVLLWEETLPGLRCKTQRLNGRQLRIAEYTRDMAPHWCERGHIGYILDGQFELRFEQQTIVFKAGDGVFIPPGPVHRHMGRALTDVVRIVFVEDV